MRDDEIDDLFARPSGSPPVDPALLERISQSIGSSLKPVRPLPPSWVLAAGLAAVCVAVAFSGAAILGLHGIRNMNAVEIAWIFPLVGVLIWMAASGYVKQMVPGSRIRAAGWTLPVAGAVLLVAAFGLAFHDYGTERFVVEGMKCLTAGLLQAIPAGLLGWLILRRGFAVNSAGAWLALASLAGLTGIGMLELHCPRFEAPHAMVWHTAVLPLSCAVGAVLARLTR